VKGFSEGRRDTDCVLAEDSCQACMVDRQRERPGECALHISEKVVNIAHSIGCCGTWLLIVTLHLGSHCQVSVAGQRGVACSPQVTVMETFVSLRCRDSKTYPLSARNGAKEKKN
jgi:hypothetical protein